MRRREFVAGAMSIIAGVSRVSAQPAGASQRLAIFSPAEPSALMQEKSDGRYYRALFEELRRLGHVEGQNLIVERYGVEQNSAGPVALAAEIIRSNPDVVFVIGPGAPIFKEADARFPIVALTAIRSHKALPGVWRGRAAGSPGSVSIPVRPFMASGSHCCMRCFPPCRSLPS